MQYSEFLETLDMNSLNSEKSYLKAYCIVKVAGWKSILVLVVYTTYYQSKEITTVSKDMSVSSLGAKINSEENSPPLPEFSICYFEKLWWYLALSRWPQNTNTVTSKIRGKSRSVIDSQSCDTWKMKWLYVFISISSVLVKVSQSLPDIIKIGK